MYTVVITVFNFVVSIQLYVKALTEMAMDIQGRLDGTCQRTPTFLLIHMILHETEPVKLTLTLTKRKRKEERVLV